MLPPLPVHAFHARSVSSGIAPCFSVSGGGSRVDGLAALSSVTYFSRIEEFVATTGAHTKGEHGALRTAGCMASTCATGKDQLDAKMSTLELDTAGSPPSSCFGIADHPAYSFADGLSRASSVGVCPSSELPCGSSFSVSPCAFRDFPYASFYHPTSSKVRGADEVEERFRRSPASYFFINPPLFFAPRFSSRHFASLLLYEGCPSPGALVVSFPSFSAKKAAFCGRDGAPHPRTRFLPLGDAHDWRKEAPFRLEEREKDEEGRTRRDCSRRQALSAPHPSLFTTHTCPVCFHFLRERGGPASSGTLSCHQHLFSDLSVPVQCCPFFQPFRRFSSPPGRSSVVAKLGTRAADSMYSLPDDVPKPSQGGSRFFSKMEDRSFSEGAGCLTGVFSRLLAAYRENKWTGSACFVGRIHDELTLLEGLDSFPSPRNFEVTPFADTVPLMAREEVEKLLVTEERRLAILEELRRLMVERLQGLRRLRVLADQGLEERKRNGAPSPRVPESGSGGAGRGGGASMPRQRCRG